MPVSGFVAEIRKERDGAQLPKLVGIGERVVVEVSLRWKPRLAG